MFYVKKWNVNTSYDENGMNFPLRFISGKKTWKIRGRESIICSLLLFYKKSFDKQYYFYIIPPVTCSCLLQELSDVVSVNDT